MIRGTKRCLCSLVMYSQRKREEYDRTLDFHFTCPLTPTAFQSPFWKWHVSRISCIATVLRVNSECMSSFLLSNRNWCPTIIKNLDNIGLKFLLLYDCCCWAQTVGKLRIFLYDGIKKSTHISHVHIVFLQCLCDFVKLSKFNHTILPPYEYLEHLESKSPLFSCGRISLICM